MPSTTANLAPLPTTFVGRREMLASLARAVDSSRLVTVLGPPGVGKTRLVREHALASASRGVFFCDLTEASTLEGAIERIASVLVPEHIESELDETKRRIAAALSAHEPALVILDNFEQLVGSAATLVSDLLDATPPGVRFVVTSRELLAANGEAILELPPLALPAIAGATESEAVELFVERARAALPSFDPSPAELDRVAELVRLLDGLPLAIELAAARVSMLQPSELIERIGRRFGWLTESPLAQRSRRATLWEAIDASWALLAPWEQAALAQVSVFRGGFSIAAAEAVIDLGAFERAPPALDVLQSLRDKSLLAAADPDRATRRFALLASIREFAEAKLEDDGARARHARYFVLSGESLTTVLDERDDPATRRKLRLEHENLLAVHERFLDSQIADLPHASLRAALVLARIASAYVLSIRALDRALAASPDAEPRLVARALEARGNARRFVGQVRESVEDFERMHAIATARSDRSLAASALSGLGNAATVRARWDEARRLFERALEILVDLGERRAEGRVLAMLAATRFNQDDPAAARELLVRAVALVRESNDRAFEGICVTSLGIVSLALGSLSQTRSFLAEALELHRASGARHWEGVTLSYLALAEQEEGRLDRAGSLYREALAILSEVGVRRAEGLALAASAGACLLDGALDEAKQRYRRALELARVMSPDHEGLFIACLGVVAALEGDVTAANDAFDGAERALASHERPAFDAAVQVHRGHLALARDPNAPEARERLALADAWIDRSADVRFARDALARSIRALERDRPANALVVGPNGVWFKLPRAKKAVRLHRRRALHRLVHTLADRRLRAPGAAVSIPELVESGWPAERVLPDAGTERVYTAIATLRKLGLRKLLLQSDDGYLLDPRIDVVWSLSVAPP